jgi:acyl-coenzyme A synthetase/AMP-(fatty) acid ligase
MLKFGIERCARRLVDLDIGRHGPIAVLVANPIRHLTLCFALFRLGIPSISLEHGQSGIRSMTFAAVLGDGQAAAAVDPGNRLIETSDEWFADDLPASSIAPAGFSDPTQPCRISLTSGATGLPKLVEHPIESYSDRILRHIDLNWRRVLCMPGLSSNWGFLTSCAALATGRTVCFAGSPFQAMRMIELYAIDFIMASTEQLLVLAHAARTTGAQPQSLRTIWFGGTVPTRTLLESAMIYLCNDILCRYAASETGLIAQTTAREMLRKPGLVGRVVPGVEVRIFEPDGQSCPPGKVGLVKVKAASGPAHTNGDGTTQHWIDLGDLGWMDTEGCLYVVGRVTDAGTADTQLSPVHEIEHILRLECDLIDAAAVLVDHGAAERQTWIGIVGATDLTPEKLAPILAARGFHAPIKLFSLPVIPRGSNGKVNRPQLKAMMQDLVNRTWRGQTLV